MSATSIRLRAQILELCRWAIGLPALALWPFLSALPAFGIIGRANDAAVLPNIMFFMTGFYPAIAVVIAYRMVLGRIEEAGMKSLPQITALGLGAYAALWTVAYGAFAMLAR